MDDKNFNLFYVLLKLKSYVVSMLEENDQQFESFYYVEEYLDRKYPEKKEEIIEMLVDNGINSDRDIAFDTNIIVKFKKMSTSPKEHIDMLSLLKELEIETEELSHSKKSVEKIKLERNLKLNEILTALFKLATNWAYHKELEDKVDDYAALHEEEVIRPEEEAKLDLLGDNTSVSFATISNLTKTYINHLTDYYFNYGGDITLKDFVEDLDKTKISVAKRYVELFKKNGLDTDELEKHIDN